MDQKAFPLWRDRYPMVDAEHTHLLETSAAIHEFLHRLPRHHAEFTAHNEYRRDQLAEAAGHHLAGIKSAHALGNMEEAKKHGVMYALAMKQLGHDPVKEPPPEVTAKLKNMSATKPLHKFKAHKGDAFSLPPAPKEETEPIQKYEPLEKRSKNVRQHIVSSASDEGKARLTRYAQGRGLQIEPEKVTGVFPKPKGNTVVYHPETATDRGEGGFPIGHEVSHVLMTSPGQTAEEHGALISNRDLRARAAAGIADDDETLADATNRKLDRRAGVKREYNQNRGGEYADELRNRAAAVIKPYDDGAHFDSEGRMQKPAGINHRVNTGQSGVTGLKAARPSQPPQPLKPSGVRGLLHRVKGLFKMEGRIVPNSHPHSYPWHDGHTSHHRVLQKDAAPVAPPPAPNTGVAQKGVSTYGKHAAAYGTVDKTKPSQLKFYNLAGKSKAVQGLVASHGYQVYYAGGKHGQPDLATKNYNTGHLMIYDPTAGSGGDFGEHEYTDSWRQMHELAHGLTHQALNAKYGEGRRIGGMGKQRTLHEAKRAVEWEWLAVHKQRELSAQLGIHVSDEDFHREANTVMHDAVHRAVTGKFTEPSDEGFVPHPHKVPLEHAFRQLHESAAAMGLADEKSLVRKFEPLEKRSKNVREQTRNLAPEVQRQRLADYSRRIGLKPVPMASPEDSEFDVNGSPQGFPQPHGNQLPHDYTFPVQHETAHAMMTAPGQTIREHNEEIVSDRDGSNPDFPASYDEHVASNVETRIARRAGASAERLNRTYFPPKSHVQEFWDPESTEVSSEKYKAHLGAKARETIAPYDEGAHFDETGERQKARGIDARVNSGESGVIGMLRRLNGMHKSEPLEKRSKNVREQIANISPEQAEQRRERYVQSTGLKPVNTDQTNGFGTGSLFPHARDDKLPYGGEFPIEHEAGHALHNPTKNTLAEWQDYLGANRRSTAPDHRITQRAENVASSMESRIDRRAGVSPSKFAGPLRNRIADAGWKGDDMEIPEGWVDEGASEKARAAQTRKGGKRPFSIRQWSVHGKEIQNEAKASIGRFDDGARYDSSGRIQEPTGINARINQGQSGVIGLLRKMRGLTKSEPLGKSISQLPKGTKMFENVEPWPGATSKNKDRLSESLHDYSHLLPERARKEGLKLEVHHSFYEETPGKMIDQKIQANLRRVGEKHPSPRLGYVEGLIEPTTWSGASSSHSITPHSDLSRGLRGRGLGSAMYEAVYAHAHGRGITTVIGGDHTKDAHNVHVRLAKKHGFKYKAIPRGKYQYNIDKEELGPDFDHLLVGPGRGVVFGRPLQKDEAGKPIFNAADHQTPVPVEQRRYGTNGRGADGKKNPYFNYDDHLPAESKAAGFSGITVSAKGKHVHANLNHGYGSIVAGRDSDGGYSVWWDDFKDHGNESVRAQRPHVLRALKSHLESAHRAPHLLTGDEVSDTSKPETSIKSPAEAAPGVIVDEEGDVHRLPTSNEIEEGLGNKATARPPKPTRQN